MERKTWTNCDSIDKKGNSMQKNRQLTINMAANFINFGISLCISFFLSPYSSYNWCRSKWFYYIGK